MSSEHPVFATVDRGTATVAVALVGRVDARWRLFGSTAAPAGVPEDALLERLRRRLAATDATLAADLGLGSSGAAAGIPRLACATLPAPECAVVAATERVLRPLVLAASAAGWRVRPLVLDGADILAVATALADPRVGAVLAGASDPPGADERPLIADLGALVAATTERRPDLVAVLAGGLAEPGGRMEGLFRPDRPGPTVLAPSPAVGGGEPLRALLDDLRGGTQDGRRALATATGTLADVLQRRIEVVEIGQSGAARAAAAWTAGSAAVPRRGVRPRGRARARALLGCPPRRGDGLAHDPPRPPPRAGPAAGARPRSLGRRGGRRCAAPARGRAGRPRAARGRDAGLRRVPGSGSRRGGGGAWNVAPGPAVALALADVLRRPGVRAAGLDHARLLAPLGTIGDAEERHAVIADLRDDLLVPLGSVLMPAGLRPGRSAGRLVVRGEGGPAELDLVAGGLELVDLPPGERAVVELQLRDQVRLGLRTRHVAMEVAGGLGGLLVDLRDVPLQLPERLDRRRELLASWQAALWPELEA